MIVRLIPPVVMKKYYWECPHRASNPYKQMAKTIKTLDALERKIRNIIPRFIKTELFGEK